jgi:MFS family permease
MELPRRLRALGQREFRLLFTGQVVSLIGDGLVTVAIAFAVLDLTGSVADLGFVLAARNVPLVAFLLVGGVYADRLPRRTVMVAADLVRCTSQGTLAALLISGHAQLWQLLLLQAVHGTGSAFFNPASIALIPETVEPRLLPEANALRGIAFAVGDLVGPALAGVLVTAFGSGWTIAADAATFAVSAAALAGMRPAPREVPESRSVLGDLAVGWREFRSRTWLVAIVGSAALANAFVLSPLFVLGAAVAKESLGGAAAWAAIEASFGGGSIVGGVLALHLRPARPLVVAMAAIALFGLPSALLAAPAPIVAICVAASAAGAALTVLNALWATTMQEQIPAGVLSRVSAFDYFGVLALRPVGLAVTGVVAAHLLGVSATLWLVAALALISAGAGLAVPDVRRIRAGGAVREAPVPVAVEQPTVP